MQADANLPSREAHISERQLEFGLKFLDNQERQIELEQKRLDLEASLATQNLEISRHVVAAEAQDRREIRKTKLILYLGLSGIGAVLIVALALMNKDTLLVDLVKIGAGVALGWGAKTATASKQTQPAQQP